MPHRLLIGIDIGTSGTKTAIYDQTGRRLAVHTAEYPLYQPKNGWAEQDPEDWWNATVEGLQKVLSADGVNPNDVVGIGLSGQMHGLVMLDENGNVLRRSIIWCDGRTAKECEEITELVGRDRLMEITKSPALTGFTASKILWVRKHEPEIYEKCRHILLPKDYIRFKLTGAFATDVSDASGMQLLDIAARDWSDEVLEKLNIDRALLAPVLESPDVSGHVTAETAALTGVPAGTIVVGGAGDNAAAAVGCGAVRDGYGFTTIGTSGVVFSHCKELRVDPDGRIHSFCAAVPGEYHVMGVTLAAGLSLRWFRDTFSAVEQAEADAQGKDVYAIMDDKAAEIPIGANRLLFLPHLMGERTPHLDPAARGAWIGLSASHSRAHCLRAVMEGVIYSLRDCLTLFDAAGVSAPEVMMACGGGAVSPLWRQMLADVLHCNVRTAASNDGGALGAALLAGVGAGVYPSVPEACDAVIRTKTEQPPIEANSAAYEPYYQLYHNTYAAIKPICHALGEME
jgi:xylulokinase